MSNDTKNSNNFHTIKSKWTWAILYTKLLFVLFMCLPLAMCQKQCKQTSKDEVIRWRTNPVSHVIEWRLDSVCSTYKECIGFSAGQNGIVPVQLCPVKVQEGDKVFVKTPPPTYPYPVRIANVSFSDWISCPNTTHPLDQRVIYDPTGQFSEIPSRFLRVGTVNLAQLPNGVFANCNFGLRLELTVKSQNCQRDSSETTLCSNNGICGSTLLESIYTCRCSEGYTGNFCEEFDACLSSPCKNGAKCTDVIGAESRNYTCKCKKGFKGVNCTEVIGPCSSSQCNNGTCVQVSKETHRCDCQLGFTGSSCDRVQTVCRADTCQNGASCVEVFPLQYSCQCIPGFTGIHCETSIDECASNPCHNNSVCIDLVNGFRCQCLTGYTGATCNETIDYCSDTPCENGGECVSSLTGYTCNCSFGFRGPDCEVIITRCTQFPDVCENGAHCIQSLTGPIKCQCSPGWTGATCGSVDNLCLYSPCKTNSTCVDTSKPEGPGNYKCLCAPGYTGRDCEQDIDECASNPCQNGATCHQGVNFYNCTCPLGYNGTNCENNIDVCAGREDQLCLNGARCVDGDVGLEYTCNCLPGFRGSNCGVNINECESSPCQNNATCQDQVNRFFCNCTQGYFGERCESDVDHCTAQPCQNGGRCVTVLGSYRCECTGGWGGVNCTTDVDECTSQPCQNGAQCVDRLNEYSCECPVGFSGINCETNINDCKNDSCLNGANCVDLVNGFRCDCAPGFTDQTCSTDVDECVSRPCQNGGECVDQINGYQCKCDSQLFGGNQCEVALNNCSFYPCQHNSTCTPTTSSTYECNCANRYTGQNCETYLPFCPQRPCQNNATCTDIEEAKNYTCTCSPGYTGRNCEVDINFCQQHNCSQNSVCVDGITNYTCICFPGYTGQFCEMEIKECASSPCQNGATCQYLVNGYSCSCVPGFTGLHCSTNINDCVSEPCQNNGTCIDDVNAYRCRCVPGYSGINCETDLDLCGIGLCNNATNCTEINNGQNVTCTCLPGFTGYFCEVDIDDCSTSPCPDGATCVDGVNSYQCLCAGGVNCSSSVNECSSNPCQNGATCVDGIARFSCTCPLGFTGQLCEVKVDECGSSPCQNGGKCVDEVNGYRCNCSAGFSGIHCESNTDECLSSPCQNGGTCRDVVNGYICDCVQPFVGHDCSLLPCDLNPCGRNANCTNDLSVIPDGFTCQCPSGFKGKRCQSNIDDCDLADGSDPCSGRGFCVDGVDSFTCFCQPGWKGSRCEKPANDCFSNECKNNATCVDDSNGYHCKCLTGYAGEFCEKEADECETSPCKNGATCSDLFNDYSCLCRSGWTGKNCTEEVNECVFNHTTNPCLNNGTCVDIFNNFTCLCAPFYTGRLCEKRYDPCDDSYNQCRNNATCSTRSDGSYQCNCTTGWTGQNCEFRLSTPDSSIPAPTETAVSQTVSMATTTPILPSVSLETTQSGPDISTMQPTMTATTLPDTSGDLEFSTSTQIMPTRTISIDISVKVTMSSTISPSPSQSADSTLSITPSLTSSPSLTPSVLTSVSPTPGLPSSLSPTPSVSISTSLMVSTPSSIAMTSSLPDTVSVTSSPPESSMSPFPSLPTSVIISPSITTSGTFDYSDFLETSMFGVIDSTTVLGSVLGKGSSVGEITSGVGGSMSSLFPSTAAEVGTLPTIYSSTQEMQSTVSPQILSSAVITQSPEGGSTVQPASPPLSVASTIADSDKMSALVQESMVTESSSMKADHTVSITLVPSTTPSIEEVISLMSTPVLGSETALPSETITMHSEIPVISDSSTHLLSPSSDQSEYSLDLTTPHTDLSFAFTNTPLSSLFTVSTVSSTYTSGSPTEFSSYTSSLDYPTSLTDKVQPTVSTGIMVTSTDTVMSSVGLDSYTPLVSTSARTDMDMSTRAQVVSSQDGLVTPMQTLVMSDSLITETSRYDVQSSSSMLTESEVVAVTPTSVSASFDVMDSTIQKQSKQESEILLPTSLFSDMTPVVMETSDISLPVFTTTFSLSGSGTLPTYLSSTGLSVFPTETVPLDSTVVISPTVTPSVESTLIVTTPSPGVETCADSPCMNNATCVDSKNGGFAFRCVCDIRYEGQRCETARRTLYAQFNNTGYIQFDSPILQDTNTIQLSFYTTEENGLLFYSSKDYAITDDTNFIKLFTDKGILMYAFSCVMQHFNIDTKVKVNTGSLFNVTINQTSTCKASVKVSGPGAHSVVADGTDFVFPTFKLSNLSDVYLGGVPTNTSILPQNHNHSSQFSGCITDFVLNNEAYGLINSSALEGVELCGTVSPKPDPTCVNVTCDNGGTCRDVVDASTGQKRFKCDCPLHFTGQTCEEEISVYFPKFNGQSYLQHNPMNLSLSATNEIIISFKTNSTDGTLLYSAALNAEGNFVHLFIDKSVLKYQLSCGQANILSVDTLTPVSNDNLTTVVIKQSIGSNRCSVSVQIDNNEPVTTVLTTSQQPPQADLGPLYLGGLPNGVTPSAKASPFVNFVGCIRNLQVNSVERLVFKDAVAGQNIEDCDVALCSYQPCKNGATCRSDGESWYCDCRPGYTGSLCERQLCDINPCRHGGTCVMLQEKGSYVCLCPYGRQGVTCEDELQITAPSYVGLQYGYPSYVAYSKISDMETAFEMKFQFTLAASATSLQSGLMIYTGGDGKSDSDYMAVGIQSGHVVFQFDLGSGAVSIQSEQSIAQDNTTHTVYLGRYRRAGWLQVDGQQNMTGSSPGKLDGLNIFSDFYMGGYETFNLNLLPAAVNYSNSFQGCLWNFQIKTPSTSSAFTTPGRVQSGRNVQQCRLSACKLNQCLNGAQCFDLGASFRCNCTDGWKGALCADRFTLCDGGHDCASGSTCVPLPSGGFTCQCLLGRSGPKCDQNLTISDPRFEGEESYMTFQPLRNMRNLTNVRLQFKPKTLTGLMFYVAQHLKSRSGDFLAISLNKGYVELRYNLGAYPTAVIKSKMKVSNETDKWYTLEVGRDIRQGYVRLENSDLALGNSPPGYVALDTSTRLYLGGVPNLEDIASSAVENEPSAFEGCIRELIVNNRPYKLTERGALGGINVGDCDGTGCGYSVCENNGTCQVAPGSKFSCQCPTNYFGETCGTHILCKNHQCENAGICVADESRQTYTCACQLGWAGSRCEQAIQFEAAQFTGNSYIYFLDRNYSNDSVYTTDLSFNFTTSAENGVILWNGQVYSDQDDYLGIGLIGGRLRICWNLGWWSRDEVVTTETVNDNQWHSVIVQRVNQSLTLYLDGKAYLSRVSGSFIGLDTMGIYYLGGFGLEESVSEHTNNHFTSAYTGCLQHLRIGQESSAISLQHTDRGINILKCAS